MKYTKVNIMKAKLKKVVKAELGLIVCINKCRDEWFKIIWDKEFYRYELQPMEKKLQKWMDNYSGICANKKMADKYNEANCTWARGFFYVGLDELYYSSVV